MRYGESGKAPMDGGVVTRPAFGHPSRPDRNTGLGRCHRLAVVAGNPPADCVVNFRDSGRRCSIALGYQTGIIWRVSHYF